MPDPVAPSAPSPLHEAPRDNSGTSSAPLAAHQQRPDSLAPVSDRHARSMMTAGELSAREVAQDIADAQSTIHRRDPVTGLTTIEPRKPGQQDAPASDGTAAAPAAQGEKFKFGDLELTAVEISELVADKAQRDLSAAARPQTPDAYKLELPEGMTLPGGQTFAFDKTSPTIKAAQAFAHSKGLDQGTFSEMMGLYASHVAGQEHALAERSRAELAKAGVNAPQRVDAIGKWLDSFVGTADAKPLKATIVTDSHLRFMEKVMGRMVNGGSNGFNQSHRDRVPQGGLSEEAYAAMGPAERLNYARQFDQTQFTGAPRR